MSIKRAITVKNFLLSSKDRNLIFLIGPIFLGVIIGVQWLTTVLLITGLHPRPRALTELTDSGKYWFRPEYDILVYVIGCAATIMFALVFLKIINLRQRRLKLNFLNFSEIVILGCVSFIVHSLLIMNFDPIVIGYWKQNVAYLQKVIFTAVWMVILLLPGLLTALIAAVQIVSPGRQIPRFTHFLKQNQQLFKNSFDILISFCIALSVYIPDWNRLAGKVFQADQFLHWDGFVVRTALGLKHGLILGSDLFVQYGIGWPVLLNLLTRAAPLTYSYVVGIGVVYACVYYIGVYLLLRLLTKSILWSVTGISSILYVHLFARNVTTPFFWDTPSSTLLRSPFDIWFFIVLYFSIKTKNKIWHILLGLITGLALLFGFDTGMYLSVILVIYISLNLFLVKNKMLHLNRLQLQPTLASFMVFILVVVSGLFFVAQSAFFTADFWFGLFEGVREYGSGISNLPLTLLPQKTGLLVFEIVIMTYLICIICLLLRWLHGQIAFAYQFAGLLSLYGLATLLIFLGRSHILNLLHPTVPFWILIVWFSAKTYSILAVRTRVKLRLLPVGVCLVAITFLLSSPLVHGYPHLINSTFAGTADVICLWQGVADVCGVPTHRELKLDEYQTLISYLHEITTDGYVIAIADDKDTFFYMAINQAPWFRFRPGEIFTNSQLAAILTGLAEKRPYYVVMTEESSEKNDVWYKTRLLLTRYYRLKDTVAGFGIWEFQ